MMNNPQNPTTNENSGSNSQTIVEQEPTITKTETEQIITFVDDKIENDFIIPKETDIVSDSENQGLESREHTIRDFLSRPIQIGEFTWDSTMQRNDNIFTINFPSHLLSEPMIAEKISGFTYIKGDIKVRLQINRQGFQAGMMQLRWFPVVSPDSDFNTQTRTMKQFSGLNGLDVNLESEKVIILSIPYIYPTDVYDLLTMPDDWATVYGRVYSPLTAASATSVTVSIFAWFDKDSLSLSMPTSSISTKTAQTLSNYYTEKVMELQIGNEHKQASKAGGPVSSVTKVVSNVAKVASGIPGLSSIAAPVAVVSDMIGGIAGMFGFSKPTSDQTPTQVRNIYARGMANADFPDSATQTALITTNSLEENLATYRTEVDEMAFASMIRVPHFITNFNYSTSDNKGKLLFSIKLNPATMTTDLGAITIPRILTTTSLGIVSSMFELWRGSLNLTFKFCKTSFHSGRLMFVWFNVDAASFTVPDTYNRNFAKNYQYLLDLKDKYELDLNIPYLQANGWLNIHQSDTQFKDNNGILAVYVINSLQAAPSASSTVECVVEARAGSDFHFAEPKVPELLGYFINPIATYTQQNTFNCQVMTYLPTGDNKADVTIQVPVSLTATETVALSYDGDTLGPAVNTVADLPAGTFIHYDGEDFELPVAQKMIFQAFNIDQDANYIQTNVSSTDGYFKKLIRTDRINSGVLPITLFTVSFPSSYTETVNDLQIGREEAIMGMDGESIAPAIELQKNLDITPQTVGESIMSSRLLLKRYVRDINYTTGMQFGRTFIVIDPNSFASRSLKAASYLSIFSACFRFFRGSLRYKMALTHTGDNAQFSGIYKYYLFNNTTSNALPYDPVMYCNSTNLYATFNEVTSEFSIPYYNRNRMTITGDITATKLLSPMQRRIAFDMGSTTEFEVDLFKNIGEDFTFGTWLGAPTCYAFAR